MAGRAPFHRNFAKREGFEPTHCEGRVRRMFVRVGSGKYYVAVGWVCDTCGWGILDPDQRERIYEHVARGRRDAPLVSVDGGITWNPSPPLMPRTRKPKTV